MAVVATGFFDGVHLGHKAVVHALAELASQRGEEAVVVTFWPHPRVVMQKDARDLKLLTSSSEKMEMLRAAGADRVEVLPFTKEFASLSARRYVEEVLVPRFDCTAVVMGYDNRLGSDLVTADGLCRQLTSPDVIVCKNVGEISSTKIRRALEEGDINTANSMLGYEYFLNGVVVPGNRLGRSIGFPTANMELYEPLKMAPRRGVYLVRVELPASGAKSAPLFGMCNVGQRPTVSSDNRTTIETHILDFSEDIYGVPLKITFLRRLRDEVRFENLDSLRVRLESDRSECIRLIDGIF